ncbi:MAG: hypothetical protein EOO81_09255 [Oxalobacteraceae bacterium]|nr:MAG: hypothetical protein EOO81_09255 [Oxalobacteraceae bacterium]
MTDQPRIEFESWAATKGMAMHLARSESGLYVSRVTQNYMDCWMASRAAVVVELPAGQCLFDRSSGRAAGGLPLVELKTVADAIEAAGLKYEVKP